MSDSSKNNTSGDKRKACSPNWFHKSAVFHGNNAAGISKLETCSSSVLGKMDADGIVDLTIDQEVVNVDFIREYWFRDNEHQEEANDVNLLVSSYIYAAKSRSLCTEASILRINIGDDDSDDLVLIDKSCIKRLDEDIGIIDKAKTRLRNLCIQEDEAFDLAKLHWTETEQKYKDSKAYNMELKTYIGKNKSHLSALRARILKKQSKQQKSPSVPAAKIKGSPMKKLIRNSSNAKGWNKR